MWMLQEGRILINQHLPFPTLTASLGYLAEQFKRQFAFCMWQQINQRTSFGYCTREQVGDFDRDTSKPSQLRNKKNLHVLQSIETMCRSLKFKFVCDTIWFQVQSLKGGLIFHRLTTPLKEMENFKNGLDLICWQKPPKKISNRHWQASRQL